MALCCIGPIFSFIGLGANDNSQISAARLFIQLKRFQPSVQMCAAEHAKHIALLSKFGFSISGALVRKLDIGQLPVLASKLLLKDARSQKALFAVQSYKKRYIFDKLQTERSAKQNNEPIFRWLMSISISSPGCSKGDFEDLLYMKTKKLTQHGEATE